MIVSYHTEMKTLTPMDLRRSLGQILDQASAGERFLIERDHKPLAVLVSVEDAARLHENVEEAIQRRNVAILAVEEWRRRVLGERDSRPSGRSAAEFLRGERDHGHAGDQRAGGDRKDSSR
jgi:prevent-host-death family protein